MSNYVIEMNHIKKHFGKVKAVNDGNFNLIKGEIHSLIGENGAGKSTMMKLLYGMYPITSGQIKINGELIDKLSPSDAIARGIGMVHQEFMLVDNLTVMENIILGFEPRAGFKIDYKKARQEIEEYINKYHMDVQLNKKVGQISVGEAQRVEIIKTLIRGADIIILDEPTAVLTPQETEKLFEILEELRASGKSLVFISHKLNEVMSISDRITVMRQGMYEGTVNKADTNELELAKMMIGREVFLNIPRKEAKIGKTILEVKDIWVPSQKETSKIRGMSLSVREGEIVGIAGIDGNGQSELIEAITGLRKVEKGQVLINGVDVTNKTPKDIRKAGLSHIPEDRNTTGLNRALSISYNLTSVLKEGVPVKEKGFLDEEKIEKYSNDLIKKFDIRPTNPEALTSSLSGGNAQKVVVAREISLNNNLLIASQPTRGVDIGAIELIRKTIENAKQEGVGVLLVSAELEEILSLSDTIIVIHEGKITGQMPALEANENNVGLLMMGSSEGKKDEVKEISNE